MGCASSGYTGQGARRPSWLVDHAPAACAKVHKGAGRHRIAPLKLQLQRCLAARGHDEQALSVLRYTVVGSVKHMRGQRVAQRFHGRFPRRIQGPAHELWNILYDCACRSMLFCGTDHGPGRAAACVVLWISMGFATRRAVSLTAWAGQQQVVGWHLAPVRLLQILTGVVSPWVIGCVVLHCQRPVICRPDHLGASHGGTGTETTGAGEKVNTAHHLPPIHFSTSLVRQ